MSAAVVTTDQWEHEDGYGDRLAVILHSEMLVLYVNGEQAGSVGVVELATWVRDEMLCTRELVTCNLAGRGRVTQRHSGGVRVFADERETAPMVILNSSAFDALLTWLRDAL